MFQKLTNKKILLALLMLILTSAPFTHAVVLESGIPNTDLTPGKNIEGITIAQYINYIYLFVLGVVGIAVFASLVFWGVVWISSGIADRRGEALGKIKDAFTGLAIALGAYIILNTINPDLLILKDLDLSPIKDPVIGKSCFISETCGNIGVYECYIEAGKIRGMCVRRDRAEKINFPKEALAVQKLEQALIKSGTGKSCIKAEDCGEISRYDCIRPDTTKMGMCALKGQPLPGIGSSGSVIVGTSCPIGKTKMDPGEGCGISILPPGLICCFP